jgi:hypothetical protein
MKRWLASYNGDLVCSVGCGVVQHGLNQIEVAFHPPHDFFSLDAGALISADPFSD